MEFTKEELEQALQDIDDVLADVAYLNEKLPIVKEMAKRIVELAPVAEGSELVKSYTELVVEIENNLKVIQL